MADHGMKKQRDAIMRALTASKGRVGGTDGAAARMGHQPLVQNSPGTPRLFSPE